MFSRGRVKRDQQHKVSSSIQKHHGRMFAFTFFFITGQESEELNENIDLFISQ